MPETVACDLCVVGGGSAGLVVAAGASQMGASVVLVESGRMGGDCLNYGCVPSKALLAAGHAAARLRRLVGIDATGVAGIDATGVGIDFARAMARVHDTIAAIAPNDSVARFEGLGVRVVQASGRFLGPDTLEAGDVVVRARRFVVATGARPLIPSVPGLAATPYLTYETVWGLTARPDHLIVLGGGPVGVELAQAFRRLGAGVTIVEAASLLPREDPELVEVVRTALRRDGIALREGMAATAVEATATGVAVRCGDAVVAGSHLLVAVGRRPQLGRLGLDAARIAYGSAGITVDSGLRTTNRRVYAIGDVNGGPQFTHRAGSQAGLVLRSALFRLPVRDSDKALPAVTFTDPELAHVGLSEDEARQRHGRVEVLRWAFADIDRARTDGAIEGLVKVLVGRRGRILGAAIVGAHAGETIQPWVLAISRGLGIGAMAGVVAPYPTLGEINKRVATSHFLPRLLGDRVKAVVRLLARLP